MCFRRKLFVCCSCLFLFVSLLFLLIVGSLGVKHQVPLHVNSLDFVACQKTIFTHLRPAKVNCSPAERTLSFRSWTVAITLVLLAFIARAERTLSCGHGPLQSLSCYSLSLLVQKELCLAVVDRCNLSRVTRLQTPPSLGWD